MHVSPPLPYQHLVPLMFFKVFWKCATVELFFFFFLFLARVKVTNEGVWPMREQTEHTHTHASSLVSHSSPPEHIIHVMISLISAASLTAEGRIRMCG